jgi:hypothetical protein
MKKFILSLALILTTQLVNAATVVATPAASTTGPITTFFSAYNSGSKTLPVGGEIFFDNWLQKPQGFMTTTSGGSFYFTQAGFYEITYGFAGTGGGTISFYQWGPFQKELAYSRLYIPVESPANMQTLSFIAYFGAGTNIGFLNMGPGTIQTSADTNAVSSYVTVKKIN